MKTVFPVPSGMDVTLGIIRQITCGNSRGARSIAATCTGVNQNVAESQMLRVLAGGNRAPGGPMLQNDKQLFIHTVLWFYTVVVLFLNHSINANPQRNLS
ncbi:hypothetical protein [Massilia sp. CCM 8734]|uniref:hypothetical protein n=1 Tax=Massilia sp. CCM 8734 TaxID=2609283 RepID=UPI001AAED274|nr:hypothetical protein [Massilia sp. CCM 8734]